MAFHSTLASGLAWELQIEWKFPLSTKGNLGARLFAAQVKSYYLLLARVHFTTQVEGTSHLFQVPATTNCINPPGHARTLLMNNSTGQG